MNGNDHHCQEELKRISLRVRTKIYLNIFMQNAVDLFVCLELRDRSFKNNIWRNAVYGFLLTCIK